MIGLIRFHKTAGRWSQVLIGAKKQVKVIGALALRNAMAHNGHENLGFFWVVAEPMILTAGVMLMWTITGNNHGGEVGVVPFALTGYTYITLWRHVVARSIRAMTTNSALVYHRTIKFIDVIVANAALETVAVFAAFAVVYTPLMLLGYAPVAHDPLLSLGGYLLLAWFSFSFGLILLAISESFEGLDRLVPSAMYITLPFTGVFTMMDWLPSKAQKILIWSPLVTGIEMFRGGIFSADIPVHYDIWYVVLWCLGLTAVGLPLCDYVQRRVQV